MSSIDHQATPPHRLAPPRWRRPALEVSSPTDKLSPVSAKLRARRHDPIPKLVFTRALPRPSAEHSTDTADGRRGVAGRPSC